MRFAHCRPTFRSAGLDSRPSADSHVGGDAHAYPDQHCNQATDRHTDVYQRAKSSHSYTDPYGDSCHPHTDASAADEHACPSHRHEYGRSHCCADCYALSDGGPNAAGTDANATCPLEWAYCFLLPSGHLCHKRGWQVHRVQLRPWPGPALSGRCDERGGQRPGPPDKRARTCLASFLGAVSRRTARSRWSPQTASMAAVGPFASTM